MFTFSNIIHSFAAANDIPNAEYWLTKMQNAPWRHKPTLFCYNSVLDPIAQAGQADKAIRYFDLMLKENVEPNQCTYNCVVTALGKAGRHKEAQSWLEKMTAKGMEPDGTLVSTTSYFCGVGMDNKTKNINSDSREC